VSAGEVELALDDIFIVQTYGISTDAASAGWRRALFLRRACLQSGEQMCCKP